MSRSKHEFVRLEKPSVAAGLALALAVGGLCGVQPASAAKAAGVKTEAYERVPMPPGIQVVGTELEGPVFADSRGMTLYVWPLTNLRNGVVGDPKGKSACENKITTKTGGYMSPWPAGLDLPELDKRRSCLAEWPPVVAPEGAKPVGKFTVISRSDGIRQWAYDGHPLYTSVRDKRPGDTLGGTAWEDGEPAWRKPVGPPPDIPPGLSIETTLRGRQLLTAQGMAVYSWDRDPPGRSGCVDECASVWQPLVAPQEAHPHGEWSIVARAPGVRQWAFRQKPLYTYARDTVARSIEGEVENPGWRAVYTQIAPPLPKAFKAQLTNAGDVVADSAGRTVYYYSCADDSADQLACHFPDSPKAYFRAICGGFNDARCRQTWRYVPANSADRGGNQLWSVIALDPDTGDYAKPGQKAMNVWAFRGRPVFTYAKDKRPGDIEGHAFGEWHGERNGFRALWLRFEMNGRI